MTNINSKIFVGLPSDTEDLEYTMRMNHNLKEAKEFPFERIFSFIAICLITRIGVNLSFNETIGPLFEILSKMSRDFLNFCIIYFVLLLMFSLLGNINFYQRLDDYGGFLQSVITMVGVSMGNFNLDEFKYMEEKSIIGEIFLMVAVVSF